MIVPKIVLRKKKKRLENMDTGDIAENLFVLRKNIERIQKYKKLYDGCYVDDCGRMYFTEPLKQDIQMMEDELTKRLFENNSEDCL